MTQLREIDCDSVNSNRKNAAFDRANLIIDGLSALVLFSFSFRHGRVVRRVERHFRIWTSKNQNLDRLELPSSTARRNNRYDARLSRSPRHFSPI